MTEEEWLTATDPTPMLEFLRGKASDRKLRLSVVASLSHAFDRFRTGWRATPDSSYPDVIDLAERYADGLDAATECRAAYAYLRQRKIASIHVANLLVMIESIAVHIPITIDQSMIALRNCDNCCYRRTNLADLSPWQSELAPQSDFLRDIFGNPFRPGALDPGWLTSTTVAVARHMYESRDFTLMPILADALQDAGCDNDDILTHCRGPGPHVRGCWALDYLLEKC